MFQRILLPVDLSDRPLAALELAEQLSRPARAEILLLHVIETIPGLSLAEERPFFDRLERNAQAHLETLGRLLDAALVSWRAEVCLGHRVEQIISQARQEKVDLIILTTPAIEEQGIRAGLASLSFRVGLLAPCPVLLVPASRQAPARINELKGS